MSEIRTTKLVVVDDQDVPRITMGVSPEGVAELAFTDTQGNERLRLAVIEAKGGNDTVIHLRSANQGPALQLKTSPDEGSSVRLMRRVDQPLAVLEVEAGVDSRPLLMMFDPSEVIPLGEDGKPLGAPAPMVYLTVTEGQEAYLQFLGPAEEDCLRLPAYTPH